MTSSIFFIWYVSHAIHFSCLFSPFSNKAGTETHQYYSCLLRNISICNRLIKPQDSQWPLNQGTCFKHKHLLMSRTTALITQDRTRHTAFMAHQDSPQLTPAPGARWTSPVARHPLPSASFFCHHLCHTGTKLTPTCSSVNRKVTLRLMPWCVTEVSASTRDQRRTCLKPTKTFWGFLLLFQFIILIKDVFFVYKIMPQNGQPVHL